MTKVDFYLLSATGFSEEVKVIGRLSEKAISKGNEVFINVCDQDQAIKMNLALWSFKPEGFIPHGLASEGLTEPILIGWGEIPQELDDVMINLSGNIPNCFSRFNRLIELVAPHTDARFKARGSWRFYRDRGYELSKYDL